MTVKTTPRADQVGIANLKPPAEPDYLPRFRSRPGQSVPSAVRFRRLLKAAGRSFGFDCVEVTTEDPGRGGQSR